MLADYHVHTEFSEDSEYEMEEVVIDAIEKGLDEICFTDHVDFGVKLYDPSRIYYDQKQWRTATNGLCWKDDMTLHFAIGYPF